ncbi:excisionase family DNA-binding protein [Streptomyces violaceusniger]|uniref:DNA binding domain protein, excisionase family n=1 Tax=Streptomyces violaceusniger (strain Tu 4113) TaxID=653045 RepID=G2P792_STRV4|nr:excisionase family DNA-binding protein [Streptomyces violaceusniger]AEM87052.1 DNA binding domain protein, excisionase family [Streptomyces violaceusniger Tu 4113]
MGSTQAAQNSRRPLATPDELAVYLGVSKATIYQWSSRGGGVPLIRVGRHLRARWTDVDAWLQQQVEQKTRA